jgi:hypothetical protein
MRGSKLGLASRCLNKAPVAFSPIPVEIFCDIFITVIINLGWFWTEGSHYWLVYDEDHRGDMNHSECWGT